MQNDNQELTINELYEYILKNKKILIRIVFGTFIVGIFIAFGSLSEYKTDIRFLPEANNANAGGSLLEQFGGLGNLAGISLDGLNSSEDIIKPELYPEIVSSIPFLYSIFKGEINIPATNDKRTVGEYLAVYKPNSLNHKFLKYTIGLPAVLFSKKDTLEFLKSYTPEISDTSLIELTRSQDRLIRDLRKRITVRSSKATGVITLTVKMPDPNVSAEIAEIARIKLSDYILSYRLNKVRTDMEFTARQHKESEAKFKQAQQELASFRDKHQNLIFSTFKSQEEMLLAKYNLAFNVYNSMSQELAQSKIAVQKQTPVFKIISPAQVPLSKDSPRRLFILLSSIIIGSILGLGYLLIIKLFR